MKRQVTRIPFEFKIDLAVVLVQWIFLLRCWLQILNPARAVTAAKKTHTFAIPEVHHFLLLVSLRKFLDYGYLLFFYYFEL